MACQGETIKKLFYEHKKASQTSVKQANYQYSETKEALVITTHHKLALRA